MTTPTRADDLQRNAYGVMGIPIDVVDMTTALRRIETAAASGQPFLMSTVNLNFLVASRSDVDFRESLLLSDLCTADGMPVVWIARLLAIPIRERVAGSDIFAALSSSKNIARPLKVFLFGGAPGAAAAACENINARPCGITCVGYCEPGFGSVDEMSTEAIISTINASNADFLAVALGAKKGQAWLLQNHSRIRVPVRAHLGAVINFHAGTIRRAPSRLHNMGLEWLWRIKEEPQLWRRYLADGLALAELFLNRVLPLLFLNGWNRLKGRKTASRVSIERARDHKSVILSINGDAVAHSIGDVAACFADVAADAEHCVINFTKTRAIDARFLGLLVMLRKSLKTQRRRLSFTGVSPRIARTFHLNGFAFLLQDQ
jgi:N-acetylglucosaminyldiphosphoundecaprenol N-acetyl-beta-D-mannosaminyltransferase